MNNNQLLISSLSLMLAACGTLPPSPDEPMETDQKVQELRDRQGTALTGTPIAPLNVAIDSAVDAGGVGFESVSIVKAGLRAERNGSVFGPLSAIWVGARFSANAGAVELRIERACPHIKPPPAWRRPPGWSLPSGCTVPAGWTTVPGEYEYQISYRTAAAMPWQGLCSAGWNRAVPMSGIWGATGTHSAAVGARLFTFACADRVIVKCLNWGYKPYLGAVGWNKHQSCTRMAMADYCADGVTHTIEFTPVDFYDPAPGTVNTRAGGMHFEAAWLTGQRGALCLTKTRWQTLPIGGYCHASLPDPREDQRAKFCEDYPSLDSMVMAGAMMFNDSAYIDKGLYTWHLPATSERNTTTDGFYGGAGDPTVPPAPGYQFQRFEGAVFAPATTPDMRPGTVPLSRYSGPGGDFLTTTLSPGPAGYALVGLEGYVYPPGPVPAPGAVPLNRWRNPMTGDHLTTTDPTYSASSCAGGPCVPGAPRLPPNGYVYVRQEGFLPR